MQSKCIVLLGSTANTPDGSKAPDPMPILIRIDGGLSSIQTQICDIYPNGCRRVERQELCLPEKLVKSVVDTQVGMRGAHSPFEHSTLVSPSNLYNPKSLQRA